MKRRAAVCLIALTGLFRRRPPVASCAGSGCRLPQAWLRLRSRCAACIILMQLCSGCAVHEAPAPLPEPVLIRPARCPRPEPPALPKLTGLAFLESREGYSMLKMRDERMRAYIKGLEKALDCYEAQVGGEEE